MNVKIKSLHPDFKIPEYSTAGSACFDLVSLETIDLYPGTTRLFKLGFAIEIPEGYEMQIIPRSGNSLKTKLRIANSPGCIDSDYREEVGVIVDNIENYASSQPITIVKGNRIAQAKITPVPQVKFELVEELSITERTGGYGSTGK